MSKNAKSLFTAIIASILLSGCVADKRPPLDYGKEMIQRWSTKTNQVPAVVLPPLPIQRAVKAASVVRNVGSLVVAWDMPALVVQSFRLYNTNGTLLQTVSGIYSNATLRGLKEGERISIYAVSVDGTNISDRSNIASGIPARSIYKSPVSERFVDRFMWQCAPGATNALQSSTNLTQWTNVLQFRGTNGIANVLLTNPANFHRVMIRNATNVAPMTLTQNQFLVVLKWIGDGKTNILQREVDATSGSFETVMTSSATGNVQTIQPAGKVWRLMVNQ